MVAVFSRVSSRILSAAVLAALASLAQPAMALDNGGFDAALTGWTTAGDASWQAGTAVLTTAFDANDDGGVNFNLSGSAPLAAGLDLEVFAGVVPGALDDTQPAYEGSALRQTFTVAAGDRLTFDWRLLANDTVMPDLAFVVLDGALTPLALSTHAQPGAAAFGYASATGWASFSQTFTTAGTHTLALGVADRGDYVGTTALQLDNVLLSPVPDADGAALALFGLGALGALARRRSAR